MVTESDSADRLSESVEESDEELIESFEKSLEDIREGRVKRVA